MTPTVMPMTKPMTPIRVALFGLGGTSLCRSGGGGGAGGAGGGAGGAGNSGGASALSDATQQPLQSHPSWPMIASQVKDSFSTAHDSLRSQRWPHGSSPLAATTASWQSIKLRAAATDAV